METQAKATTKNTAKEEKAPQVTAKNDKALEKLKNELVKKFGDNIIRMASEVERCNPITRIPTGSLDLDIKLGGGIPLGKFTHVSGAFSSTKTTQMLHTIANAQKMGLVCAMFDIEGTTDMDYLIEVGVDPSQLLYVKPTGLEECAQMILDMQRSGEVHLALIDSIAVLFPTKEIASEMDETVQMGIKQKMMGEFLGKYQLLNNKLEREGKTPFTLLATNQLRDKIGAYGDPEYYTGGKAIGFYATVDMKFRRGDWLQVGTGDNKEIVGQVVKYKIEKNKTYKRMQSGEFDFYFADNDSGTPVAHNDNYKSIIIEAIAWGLIQRGGAWFSFPDPDTGEVIKFQGVDKVVSFLRGREDIVMTFKEEILKLASKKGVSEE